MRHDELLGKAGEYLRGKLPPLEAAEVIRHLGACPDCRALLERWPQAIPAPDFTARVMAAVAPPAGSLTARAWGWRNFLAPMGSAAAAILIVAAFWHPEKSWVKDDKSFAAFDHAKPIPLRGGGDPMNKNILMIVMGLLAGLAAGSWAMRLYFDRTLAAWNPADRMLYQLSGDLRLNPEQRARVAVILARQKDRMEELRQQWRFQVVALDRQGEDEIAGLLTGDQVDRFMKLHDQIHGRMDRLLWNTNSGASAIAIAPPGN